MQYKSGWDLKFQQMAKKNILVLRKAKTKKERDITFQIQY